jgi:hypothetical protein
MNRREFAKYLKRRARDRRLTPEGVHWKQRIKASKLRARMDREDDQVEMPAPRPPKPPRRDKRGQGKPGRRI